MKVVMDGHDARVNVREIRAGMCFVRDGEVWIKLASDIDRAVCLNDGVAGTFQDELVTPVEAEVHIK